MLLSATHPLFRLVFRPTLFAFLVLGCCFHARSQDSADELIKDADVVQAEIVTNLGTIGLELDAKRAPVTVKNFVQYALDGFYEETIFHRVIGDFMIQGGGLTADLKRKETREPIKNESGNGLENVEYTIAMARTGNPHSATSQFFINVGDNRNLDRKGDRWGYAVFGKVVAGKDVVDKIKALPTRPRGVVHADVPVEPVVIEKVVIKPAS